MFEILLALKGSSRHGYAILKVLEARDIRLPASLLYRKLKRLMDDGLVEMLPEGSGAAASSDARRRYYRITTTGGHVLRAEAARIVALARSGHVRKLAADAKGDRG